MSWDDRLLTARYTAPSGQSIDLAYEVLEVEFNKKTAAYEFPDADGTFVQDLGISSRRFPMRVYLSGEDYDQQAATFDRLLRERGPGVLQHPQQGSVNVVPFGAVSRRDDLATEANQAVYDVSFYETITELYPTAERDPTDPQPFEDAAAQEYADGMELETASERAQERNRFNDLLDTVDDALEPLSRTLDDTAQRFDQIRSGIQIGLDTLIGQPLDLAFQAILLVNSVINAGETTVDRVSAYRDLLDQILDGGAPSSRNDLEQRGLIAGAALSAGASAAISGDYQTRQQAVQTAAALSESVIELGRWRDDAPVTDTSRAFAELLQQVGTTARALIDDSFALAQEQAITYEGDRALVEVAADLYDDPDQLDFLINTNRLTGSEILLIPGGRTIVYYV